MNKINCFVPFSGAAQAEKTVKGLQETGLVNNIICSPYRTLQKTYPDAVPCTCNPSSPALL